VTRKTELMQARTAVQDCAWKLALESFAAADAEAPLSATDLESWALSAYLVGQDDVSVDVWARACQQHLDEEQVPRGARCAFGAAFQLLNAGELARGGGWLSRAMSILDAYPNDCVERGYVLGPLGIQQIESGEYALAKQTFEQANAIAVRFDEPDLLALAQLGLGHVKIQTGRTEAGVKYFDEVMVAATTGQLSTVVCGLVYCATIMACRELCDLQRANEWTRALSHWCERQPDLVPFRGQCMVHRSEIMQLQGAWPDAMREVHLARERLADPSDQPAIGMAYYQQGELLRLRGEFTQAEAAYRQASQYGHPPQPGLALLWHADGRVGVAATSVLQALDETSERLARSRLLPAYVEIALSAGDLEGARRGADELSQVATELSAPLLRATAAMAEGAVDLASEQPSQALDSLLSAWGLWQDIGAPYEAARARVLIGCARKALGDPVSASMEFDAAGWAFRQLGAAYDIVRLERLVADGDLGPAGPLTGREVEVLRLVATGATNRAIAVDLVLSEKTVARHLSNIFRKLDVSSRSAATAYAYEHQLIE
jgi:DNA-binding CsgD family transcriptional regulator